jgi:hypothetical protein
MMNGVQKREPRMLHSNSRERTALHEAAHAVAVKAYGFPIDFVEICADASNGVLGQIVHTRMCNAWADTVVSLAGNQGELAFCNDEPAGGSDLEHAEQSAREVDSENSDEIMRLARVAAMKIVRENRTLISTLAVILERKDKLSGAEIDSIVGSIAGEVRPGPTAPDMTPTARARRDAMRRRARRDYEGAAFIEKWIRQREQNPHLSLLRGGSFL